MKDNTTILYCKSKKIEISIMLILTDDIEFLAEI